VVASPPVLQGWQTSGGDGAASEGGNPSVATPPTHPTVVVAQTMVMAQPVVLCPPVVMQQPVVATLRWRHWGWQLALQ